MSSPTKAEEEFGIKALKLEKIACQVLLSMFYKIYHWENETERDNLKILLKNKTSKDQAQALESKSPDDWDITFLSLILRTYFDTLPANMKEIQDGIYGTKKLRNDVCHNNDKLRVCQQEYKERVVQFKKSMSKLGRSEDQIKDMLEKAEKIVHLCDIKVTTTWTDLYSSLQCEIKNKQIKFQDKLVKLGKLSDNLSDVDSIILYQLSEGKTPEIVKNTIPKLPSYHIKRSLKCRTKLDLPFMQLRTPKSWMAVGVTDERHMQNFKSGLCDSKSYRFNLVTDEEQFTALCEHDKAPVHLIKYLGGNSYEWVKSKGSVQTLQQYVDRSQKCLLEEEIPISISEKIVIVSDSPGTGKTSLLASIASNIVNKDANEAILVQFISMTDFVQQLDREHQILKELLVDLIAEQASNFEFGRKLVAQYLNSSEYKCFLMFDGLDEVPSNQLEIAINVLKTAKSLNPVQIYVTTRGQLGILENLEIEMQTFGYTIQPFNRSDQKEFLLSFWEKSDEEVVRNDLTKNLADYLLGQLSTLNSSADREIAGIPLQCYLLADLNTKQANDCSLMNPKSCYDYSKIKLASSFQMYLEHIILRFKQISSGDQFLNLVSLRVSNRKNHYQEIKNAHMYFALKELFPHEASQFQSLCASKWLNELSQNELCEYGILEGNNACKLQFVHRTFAEFFVAWFAVEKQLTGNAEETNFIISKIFSAQPKRTFRFRTYDIPKYEFNFPVVCYFIDQFMKYIPKQGSQSTSVTTLVKSSEFTQLAPSFYASVSQNFPQIPEALTRYYGNKLAQFQSNVLEDNLSALVINAILFRSREVLEILCDEGDVHNLNLTQVSSVRFTFTPLHLAIQFLNSDLVDYLLPKSENNLEHVQNLLRFCIDDSSEDLVHEIRELKSKVFNLLLHKNQELATECLSSVLLEKNLKWDCLEKLILLPGINVNIHDENKNTMLHKLCDYTTNLRISSLSYYRVVKALSERKFKYFNLCNEKHITPLQYAVKHISWGMYSINLAFTLNVFASQGADFNHVDESGDSVLFYAISDNSLDEGLTLSSLLAHGADINHSNKNGENVLHICAKYDNFYALKYFSSYNAEMKVKLNNTNREGNTPLHLSITGFETYTDEEQCQIFLINEETVNAKNSEGQTPFMRALTLGYGLSREVIQQMDECGLVMTKSMASEALKIALLRFNNNGRFFVGYKEPSKHTATLAYLFEKGGQLGAVFMENLWKCQKTQGYLEAIIKNTKINATLLDEALTRGLMLPENVCMEIHATTNELEKSSLFYDFVLKQPNSLERIFNILLANKQHDAVLSLEMLLIEVASKLV